MLLPCLDLKGNPKSVCGEGRVWGATAGRTVLPDTDLSEICHPGVGRCGEEGCCKALLCCGPGTLLMGRQVPKKELPFCLFLHKCIVYIMVGNSLCSYAAFQPNAGSRERSLRYLFRGH